MMMKNGTSFNKDEAVKLIQLIQKLSQTEQMGVLMMVQGAQMLEKGKH